jgi:hypothetical protein
MALSSRPPSSSLSLGGDGETNVSWYVVYKERSKTLIQTADDKDDALSVACGLSLQGQQVLCVGPLGSRSDQEIEGAQLKDLLRKLLEEGAKAF